MGRKAFIWTDGGSRGNPGPAAIGVVIKDETGKVHARISQCIGLATNNIAEYRALIAGLEKAVALGVREITVYSDSELLVRQTTGRYRVRNEGLKPLQQKVSELSRSLEAFRILAVPREENKQADALVNQALDARR